MASNYTGNPIGVQAPASAPGAGVAPILSLIQDADGNTAANLYQAWKVLADYVAYLTLQATNASFGDGSDGNVTFDGSSTVLGLAPSSGKYTLTRDLLLNNCTVSGASTQIFTNGYRIYGRGTLTTSGGASINSNGVTPATGSAPGAGPTGGSVGGGTNGGTGGNSGAGSAAVTASFAAGGAGGAGGAQTSAGGAGGTITNGLTANAPGIRLYAPHLFGLVVGATLTGTPYTPGSVGAQTGSAFAFFGGTGGGGGGSSANTGGGGGGGGGVCAIAFRNISLANGTDIQAKGGAGASGVVSAGGGGGGGGGVILLAYATLAITSGSISAAVNCAGGAGGTGVGASATGTTGANGIYVPIQLA